MNKIMLKRRYDPTIDRYVKKDIHTGEIYGEGLMDIFKSVGRKLFSKTVQFNSIQFNSNLYFDTVKNSSGFGTIYNYITIINKISMYLKSLTYNYIKLHLFSMNAVFLI